MCQDAHVTRQLQTLLQLIHVVKPQLIDSLLDYAPYLVGLVDRVEVRTVLWPQTQWNESYTMSRFIKIRTSNFHKVVQQHTELVVGSIIWVLFEIYLSFQQSQNFESLLRTDKVIVMSLVYYFFGTQCSWCDHLCW